MSDILSGLKDALRSARENTGPDMVKLAVVTGFQSTGHVLVVFDGESAASTRGYVIAGDVPKIGNRVLMQRSGSTWVCTEQVDQWGKNVAIRGVLAASNQSIANATWETVANVVTQNYRGPLDQGAIVWQGGGVWKINAPGWYVFQFAWCFNSGGGAARFGAVAAGGTRQVAQGFYPPPGHQAGGFLSWEAQIAANTDISFQVYQDSGAALTLIQSASPEHRTWYTIRRAAQ